MQERLAPLCLVPPPTETPWSGMRARLDWHRIRRQKGKALRLELPLFWYDPGWHRLHHDLADALALEVTRIGILVAALRSELSKPDETAKLLQRDDPAGQLPPRMVPYRPERYGVVAEDFDDASIIDVRLAPSRDTSGRYAYPQSRIQRWEATPAGEPLAGGSWLPAATFPPDVVSLEQVASKFEQLRCLSPTAAIFASISPCRLDDELPRLVSAKPDGVILRFEDLHLDGLQLAALTRRARRIITRSDAGELPLWLVPGSVSPVDAVKLLALGATAIAVDSWCDPLIKPTLELRTESGSAFPPSVAMLRPQIQRLVERGLVDRLDRFIGHYQSLNRTDLDDCLGSFSAAWTKALGIRPLG